MLWANARNEVLAKMSNFFHEALMGQRPRWELQRTQKSQRFTKIDRLPQEVVSSLSSEVCKPRLLPWWDSCRQNVSTYGETGLHDLSIPFPNLWILSLWQLRVFRWFPWSSFSGIHTWDSLLQYAGPPEKAPSPLLCLPPGSCSADIKKIFPAK